MLLRLRLPLLAATLLILALAVAALLNARPALPLNPAYLDEPLAAPNDWFDAQRQIGADRGAYARALAQARRVAAHTRQVHPEVAAAEWTLLGPTNIGGRVTDLVVDPSAEDTIFVAAASGGVWKSVDAGLTFTRAWPDDVTQAVGALAVDSVGTLYAGTGESSPGGGSIVYGGTGVYRSTDSGATWQHIGLPASGAIGRIAVHPEDDNVVFVAASGNLFVPGGERGIYRTTDAGQTWERVLKGSNDTTGGVDLAVDPANPDNVLATLWDHYRTPAHRVYAGVGSGLYRSADGGNTWTQATDVTMPEATDNGRIGVAFSPSDPSRAYAIIANKLSGHFGAFFRSDDGGATWTKTSATGSVGGSQSSFGWWFGRIWVDPDEKDRLFVPGVSMTVSTNGGNSFTTTGSGVLHADQHAMAWDPRHAERVYVGNDGGVYRSESDGDDGTWIPGQVQGWTQHYSVDVGEQTGFHVVTGLQDNGCNRAFLPDGGLATKGTWTTLGLCGDGLATLINPADETITYSCSQYGSCGRQRAGAPDINFRNPPGRKGWFAPIVFDPTSPSTMYYGTEKVHRSADGGNSWTDITGFDMADPEGILEQDDPGGYRIRGVVTAIGIGKDEPNAVYAGTDNGRLWVTRDGGANWTEITEAAGIDGRWITRVTVDPADADNVYVTLSGYRGGEDAPHVLRSTDGGATFENLSANLPVAPVNDVVLTGDSIAVATDVGVYLQVAASEGAEWARLGQLPFVPVHDLRYHAATDTLTAATFGHGIQRVTLP